MRNILKLESYACPKSEKDVSTRFFGACCVFYSTEGMTFSIREYFKNYFSQKNVLYIILKVSTWCIHSSLLFWNPLTHKHGRGIWNSTLFKTCVNTCLYCYKICNLGVMRIQYCIKLIYCYDMYLLQISSFKLIYYLFESINTPWIKCSLEICPNVYKILHVILHAIDIFTKRVNGPVCGI